ncbi:hypothetical protein CYLTODRAFT_459479 [Cylindrobasidium torrendii FP15055 ss-10]|uniref:Uncharacterized protein n=1 Tax=Cylindrobasidium torrendii FP15055 ss-10 TaxID=1314674 RepID=A0A0D7AUJ8_9AGAR|nr:hypothetical protein CYLTODRAFT_459479 [Cylindrobasidium torrendii FP15055 ss-10]
MSVPTDFTTQNLSGQFTLDKSKSSSLDEVFRLQGVGFVKRKAFGVASVTTYVHHHTTDGVEHLNLDNVATGGLPGVKERNPLNNVEASNEDSFFGKTKRTSRRTQINDLSSEWLKKAAWTDDTKEFGVIHLSSTGGEKKAWTAETAWGVQLVNGERHLVQAVDFTGPDNESLQVTTVYALVKVGVVEK